MPLRKVARNAALAVLAVVIVPPVSEFFVRLAWNEPTDPQGLLAVPGQILALPWFWPLLTLIVGTTGGLWLDAWLKRKDSAESVFRVGFAGKLKQFSDQIKGLFEYEFEKNKKEFRPPLDMARIEGYVLTLEHRYKIPRPAEVQKLEPFSRTLVWIRYFHFVGTLLGDGHVKEARQWVRDLNENFIPKGAAAIQKAAVPKGEAE